MIRCHRAMLAIVLALALLAPVPSHAAAEPEPGAAAAAAAAAAREVPVEGFMTLTGRVVVDADGSVSAYAIDHAAQVPDEVEAFLARKAARWQVRFDEGFAPPAEPVSFTARVRASPTEQGLYRLWLDGMYLDEPLPAAHRLRVERRRPPAYPRDMARVGASGIVYMLVRIGADGRVEDAFAEQVDLTAMPPDPSRVPQYQLEFIASAMTAVRQWRFRIPAEGPFAGEPHEVRVPIIFAMFDRPMAGYGEWEYLVRGVRKPPPWRPGADADMDGAVAATGIQHARSRMWLAPEEDGSGG